MWKSEVDRKAEARCPAHDDQGINLSVSMGEDGRVLLNCHAGCVRQAILGVLRLTERDLSPGRTGGTPGELMRQAGIGYMPLTFESTDTLDQKTVKTWTTIERVNDPPVLFRHGGGLARVECDEEGAPGIRPVKLDRLRYYLASRFKLQQKKGDFEGSLSYKRVDPPPRELLENLLATPEPPLPVLTRVVEVPVFAADGSLHDGLGYSAATRSWHAPGGLEVPVVPAKPTAADVTEAKRLLLEDLLGNFPFAGDVEGKGVLQENPERAHAVALLLLPFVRELVDGPTPLHLVEAPSPGTGKTLLIQVIGIITSGRALPSMTEGRDEDEWRKRIFAKLRRGPSIVVFDNLRRRLDSAALSSAITEWPTWEDRVLGVSEVASVPVRCAWAATGNNPSLSSEMARRTVRIRLDAKVDRPWLRAKEKEFRHPDLRGWAAQNRGRLVWAALVLVRRWLALGRPDQEPTCPRLGMFECWSKVLGGVLHAAGIEGFLGNLEDLYERADEEGAAWRIFLSAWWERFHEADVRVRDLFPLAFEVDGLGLGEGSERSMQTRLGIAVRERRDRVHKISEVSVRVEEAGLDTHSKVGLWQLRRC